jgi:hypothetical protein
MTRITVVGSINLDFVATGSTLPEPGETVTGATLAIHPGGKGANQALAARRLGAEVRLIGRVGADAMADYFARAFKTPGFLGFVRTPDVVTIAAPPQRAMERGHWSGGSLTGRFSGEYLAAWVPTPTGWKLRSETFVTLSNGAPGKP